MPRCKYSPKGDGFPVTLRSEALQYDELGVSIKPLLIYQKPTTERNAEQIRRLLQEGISQGGAAYGRAV
ncbi:MAG: hypothetical protein K0Q73_4265 [Paenibacillus sp.]|jgi:hypothetical protein|nr:hypothetical protein [Paenibacillus sp.]